MFTLTITDRTNNRYPTSPTWDPFNIGPDLSIVTISTFHFFFYPFIFLFHNYHLFRFFWFFVPKTGYIRAII
jgi:hypothetical protein